MTFRMIPTTQAHFTVVFKRQGDHQFVFTLTANSAMFKKQGTSGLPEVTNNIDGTQSCKQHMQLTVDGEGCLNFSNFFCISWT